jgi:hypothetical protein
MARYFSCIELIIILEWSESLIILE